MTVTFDTPVTLAGGNLTIPLDTPGGGGGFPTSHTSGQVIVTPFANSTTASGTFTVPPFQTDNPLDSIFVAFPDGPGSRPLVEPDLFLTTGATLQDAQGDNAFLMIPNGQTLAAHSDIVIGALVPDEIGVVRPTAAGVAQYSLNSTGSGTYNSGDVVFTYGLATDTSLAGNWTGSGYDNIAVARPTSSGVLQWTLDSNGDNVYDSGDAVTSYGINGDTPVAGNWNGGAEDEIGVVRQTASGALQWVLNTSGSGVYNGSLGSFGDATYLYGANGDTPVVGDWIGQGSQIGVVRPTSSGVLQWTLHTNGFGYYDSSDTVYYFGANGDIPVVGDWTGSGKTEIGVVVPQANGSALWVLDTSGTGVYTSSDPTYTYGLATDRFLAGKWQAPAALYSGDGVLPSRRQR